MEQLRNDGFIGRISFAPRENRRGRLGVRRGPTWASSDAYRQISAAVEKCRHDCTRLRGARGVHERRAMACVQRVRIGAGSKENASLRTRMYVCVCVCVVVGSTVGGAPARRRRHDRAQGGPWERTLDVPRRAALFCRSRRDRAVLPPRLAKAAPEPHRVRVLRVPRCEGTFGPALLEHGWIRHSTGAADTPRAPTHRLQRRHAGRE